MSKQNRKPTSGSMRSRDPLACNAAFGITSFSSAANKLRYCHRPKATCPYHQGR